MHRLRLERVFDAPVDKVFEGWTSPDALARWAWGSIGADVTADVDLRPGGRYEIATARPDGTTWTFSGTYLEVVKPTRIAYTVEWSAPMGYESPGEKVTVEFHAQGDRTAMEFVHEGVPNEKARQVHAEGWENTFDTLAELLRESG